LFSRKNTPVSLLREAFRAELRVGKHAARSAVVRRPYRAAAAVAAVAVVGGVAAVGGTTWASASGSTPAASHSVSLADTATGKPEAGTARSGDSAPASGHAFSLRAHSAQRVKAAPHAPAVAPPAPAKAAVVPGKPAVAKPAVQHKPAAKPKPKPQHKAAPAKPYRIYDSVVPTAIPGGNHVATYSNGPYQASSASVAGRGDVLWIDVNGSNPSANALDVEPGDATPATAAAWVQAKLTKDPHSKPIVYTMLSWWSAVQASMNGLPGWMHGHVKYWIADPTGNDHVVPGADATQWYWGKSFDITTANAGFWK
jgi:hypothetical protein